MGILTFFLKICFWRETLFISVVGLGKAIKLMLFGMQNTKSTLSYLKRKIHRVLVFVHLEYEESRDGILRLYFSQIILAKR